MKKIDFEINGKKFNVVIGTADEIKNETGHDLKDKDIEGYFSSDENTICAKTERVQPTPTKEELASNIMRFLIQDAFTEVLGKAEDGYIMSEEETDKISFELVAASYRMLTEI